MSHQAEVSAEQLPGMQLAGRLAFSAAALLLLTLAYRYYKTREPTGAQGGEDAVVDPIQDAGPTEELAGERAGQEDAPKGLRHRRADGKGATQNGRENPPAWDGPVVPGRERAPAGREQKREEEEGRVEEEITLQEVTPEYSVPEEEEEKDNEGSGCVLSKRGYARSGDGILRASLQGNPTSTDLPQQSSSFHSTNTSHRIPGQKVESARHGLGVTTQEEQTPLSANGDGATRESEKGQVLGVRPIQENPAGQERVPPFQATSNTDPIINLNDMRSDTRSSISSVAKLQVGEQLLSPRQADDGQSVSPATNLQGSVCSLQSVSKPVLKAPPSDITPHSQSFNYQPTVNSLENSKVQTIPVGGGENGSALNDVPSSGAPPMQDDAQKPQTEGQKVAPGGVQRSPAAGYTLRRKESFHKIVENPELQVQMEGFRSPASGSPASSSSGEVPPLGSCPSSVKSLVGSMQNLSSDTKQKPTVEFVAGAKFFSVPLTSDSSIEVHLDLGNCYEVLCLAKKQRLEGLREAALKVMSDNYLQVLRTNAIYGRLNARERELILQGRMRGRKYVTVADVSSPDHLTSRLCYYDDQTDTWHPLAHMPVEAVSQGCSVCSMFNYLFVVAGCEGRGKHRKPSNRVFCYNPLTNIWREICPLNQARPQCKLVPLDGYLYAIGGECLYTVERYDPRLDRWTFASPLPNDTFAVAHTATACDGEIYVTGGTLHYMLLKYIGQTDTWKVTLTGGSRDRTTEMVTTNGFIYRFDLNRSMGISVYRCSIKAKLWYECATHPMPFPACFQCTVVDNLVYCVSRQFNLRFLADYVSPRFGTKELQNFPSPRGTLFPVTLVLPDREAAQTRV